MKRTKKALIAVPVVLAVLFFANGFASDCIFKDISVSMYDDVARINETDELIRTLYIDELVGYVRSTDYSKPRKALIYFGGAEEIAYNSTIRYSDQFSDFVFVSVDYPGTQDSGGKMTLKEMQNAAVRTYDYLQTLEYIDSDNIYVVGYSYGTGMATYLASQRNCCGLVLVSPYRDLLDLYDSKVPIYSLLFKGFVTDNIKTYSYARNVQSKTLIITSEKDKTFPPEIAYDLANEFSNAHVVKYESLSHSDYLKNSEVINKVREFCN